jgi:hypothetical protein
MKAAHALGSASNSHLIAASRQRDGKDLLCIIPSKDNAPMVEVIDDCMPLGV